jgi:hypothetical protein
MLIIDYIHVSQLFVQNALKVPDPLIILLEQVKYFYL